MMPSQIWEFWSSRYERLWAQRIVLGPTRTLVTKHLAQVLPDAGAILDIGCGVGELAGELGQARPGCAIKAVDSSPGMIGAAKAAHQLPNINYATGSIDKLPFAGPFDAIVTTHAFPYFPDKAGAIARMFGLLKSGGRLLIVQANMQNFYDCLFLIFVRFTVSKATYLSKESIAQLMQQAGFKVGAITRVPSWFWVPSVFLIEGIRP